MYNQRKKVNIKRKEIQIQKNKEKMIMMLKTITKDKLLLLQKIINQFIKVINKNLKSQKILIFKINNNSDYI